MSSHVSNLVPAPKQHAVTEQSQRSVISGAGRILRSSVGRPEERLGVHNVFGMSSALRTELRSRSTNSLGHTESEDVTTYLRRLYRDCPGLTHIKEPCLRTANLYERARFMYQTITEQEYEDRAADLRIILEACRRVGRFTQGAAFSITSDQKAASESIRF